MNDTDKKTLEAKTEGIQPLSEDSTKEIAGGSPVRRIAYVCKSCGKKAGGPGHCECGGLIKGIPFD